MSQVSFLSALKKRPGNVSVAAPTPQESPPAPRKTVQVRQQTPKPTNTPQQRPTQKSSSLQTPDHARHKSKIPAVAEVSHATNDVFKKEEVEKPFIPNPDYLNGAEDMSSLIHLETKNVLFNLQYRYDRQMIYTKISSILVALNPYEYLPIYSNEEMKRYYDNYHAGGTIRDVPPHCFGVSCEGFKNMIETGDKMSMVVCGESGSGKTETAKLLMKQLSYLATGKLPDPNQGGSYNPDAIEDMVLAANPILEAFGNAKTVYNNNSSRFGKFTKLMFDKSHKITGCTIETYLLERSRLVMQGKDERTYHICYFLFRPEMKAAQDRCKLTDMTKFHFMNQSGCYEVPNNRDDMMYKEMAESWPLLGFAANEVDSIYDLIATVLHLGNISFKSKPGTDGGAEPSPATISHLQTCAKLLGVDDKDLAKSITERTILMKEFGKTKTIHKALNERDSTVAKDSLAKAIYGNTFDYVVSRLNKELYRGGDNSDEDNWIGILDVFGFENFVYNSFEQLCINFANETLQRFFNWNIIIAEQKEYAEEGIYWEPLKVPDNKDTLDCIMHVLGRLDDTQKARITSPDGFVDTIDFNNREFGHRVKKTRVNPKAEAMRKKGEQKTQIVGFEVDHYADKVVYDAREFIAKNTDRVDPETIALFQRSQNKTVAAVFGTEVTGKSLTVSGQFRVQLKALMENLEQTSPFFVRCINPNNQKKKRFYMEDVVKNQLSCGGLVEALRILKCGYPTRCKFDELWTRYGSMLKPAPTNLKPRDFADALLMAFGMKHSGYALGLTKLFFRASQQTFLEDIKKKYPNALPGDKVTTIRQMVAKKRLYRAISTLRVYARLMLRRRRIKAVGGVISAVKVNILAKRVLGRKLRKLRIKMAVIPIQGCFKMYKILSARMSDRVKEQLRKKREEEAKKLEEDRLRRIEEEKQRRAEEDKKKKEEEERIRKELDEKEKQRLQREKEEKEAREAEIRKKIEEEERKKREAEEKRKKELDDLVAAKETALERMREAKQNELRAQKLAQQRALEQQSQLFASHEENKKKLLEDNQKQAEQLINLQAEFDKFKRELEHEKAVQAAEKEIEDTRILLEIKDLKYKLERAEQDIQSKMNETKEAFAQRDQMKGEFHVLERKYDEELPSRDIEIRHLKNEIEMLKKTGSASSFNDDGLRKMLEDARISHRDEVEDLRYQKDQEIKNLKEMRDELASTNEKLREAKEQETKDLKRNIMELTMKADSIERESSNTIALLRQQLSNRDSSSVDNIQQHQKELAKLQNDLEAMRTRQKVQMERFQNSIQPFQQQAAEAKKKLAELERSNKERFTQLTKEVDEQRNAVINKEIEYKYKIEHLEESISTIREQLSKSESTCATQAEDLKSIREEYEAKMNLEQGELKSLVDTYQDQLKITEETKNKEISELCQMNTELINDKLRLEAEKTSLDTTLRDEFERAGNEFEKRRRQFDEDTAATSFDNRKMRTELDRVKRRLNEVEGTDAQKRIDKLTEQLFDTEAKLMSAEGKIIDEQTSWQSKVFMLEGELQQLVDEKNSYLLDYESSVRSIEEKSAINASELERQKIFHEDMMDRLRHDFASSVTVLMSELEAVTEARDRYLQNLKVGSTDVQEENVRLKAEMDDLRKETEIANATKQGEFENLKLINEDYSKKLFDVKNDLDTIKIKYDNDIAEYKTKLENIDDRHAQEIELLNEARKQLYQQMQEESAMHQVKLAELEAHKITTEDTLVELRRTCTLQVEQERKARKSEEEATQAAMLQMAEMQSRFQELQLKMQMGGSTLPQSDPDADPQMSDQEAKQELLAMDEGLRNKVCNVIEGMRFIFRQQQKKTEEQMEALMKIRENEKSTFDKTMKLKEELEQNRDSYENTIKQLTDEKDKANENAKMSFEQKQVNEIRAKYEQQINILNKQIAALRNNITTEGVLIGEKGGIQAQLSTEKQKTQTALLEYDKVSKRLKNIEALLSSEREQHEEELEEAMKEAREEAIAELQSKSLNLDSKEQVKAINDEWQEKMNSLYAKQIREKAQFEGQLKRESDERNILVKILKELKSSSLCADCKDVLDDEITKVPAANSLLM